MMQKINYHTHTQILTHLLQSPITPIWNVNVYRNCEIFLTFTFQTKYLLYVLVLSLYIWVKKT